jgi:exopolysaccharide production protein ExoY
LMPGETVEPRVSSRLQTSRENIMSITNAEVGSSDLDLKFEVRRGTGAKRAFDIMAASIMLLFALPAMFFIAVILFSTDRGPVLFSHERIGQNGKRFRCLKFRSMVTNSQEALQRHLEMFPQARAEWEATRRSCVTILGLRRWVGSSG